MSATLVKWLAASACLGVLVPAAASAQEAEAKAAIVKLLDVGWPANLRARAEADRQYEEVLAVAGADTLALHASWLVLMQQRRYDVALQRIDEHLAKTPADLEALRAKAWVEAILKNYDASLVTADKLSAELAAHPPETEAEQAAHEELIGFLGRLVGYLGGPVAESVNQDRRKAAERRFASRIDESQKPIFEEARDGVIAKYIETTDDKLVERDRAIESAEEEKAKTLDEVAAERDEIAARSEELKELSDKLRSELRAELDEIRKEDQPLVEELARLDARATVINRDLFSYQLEIDRLERAAAREMDPAIRNQILREADRLILIASRIESDLFAVRRLEQGVQSQRAALALRARQAQAGAAGQAQKIDREATALAKRDKRTDGIERRAERPASGLTSRTRALSAQATALTTYAPYPLEAARARLLESLR
jgi:hypothetical protein